MPRRSNSITPVLLSGSGKYLLLSLRAKGMKVERYLIRGGHMYPMHKGIFAAALKEVGSIGGMIGVCGGGYVRFYDTESPKRISIYGSSVAYGPIESIDKVITLLKRSYPEYTVMNE